MIKVSREVVTLIHWSNDLVKIGACSEAVNWAKDQPNYDVAWNKCEKPEWILWLAEKSGVSYKTLVKHVCSCVELDLIPDSDHRPIFTIQTVEDWANDGNITKRDLENAYKNSWEASKNLSGSAKFCALSCASIAAAVHQEKMPTFSHIAKAEALVQDKADTVEYLLALKKAYINICNILRAKISKPVL